MGFGFIFCMSVGTPQDFVFFRKMDPNAIIPGIAYVIWVKEEDGYEANDGIYAIGFKGNSKFGHQDFQFVCKTSGNDKVFISKKVNGGTRDPSWDLCLKEMKVAKQPTGKPYCLTDRAYTFAEIAAFAYKERYFTSEEGLNWLEDRTAPSKAAAKASGCKNIAKQIINGAAVKSNEIDSLRDQNNWTSNSYLIPGNGNKVTLPTDPAINDRDTVPIDITEEVVSTNLVKDITDTTTREELIERVVLAETNVDSLTLENRELKLKLEKLTKQLKESKDGESKFMMVGDNATNALQSVNENTATAVANKLEQKFNVLSTVLNNVNATKGKVDQIYTLLCNSEKEAEKNETFCDSVAESIYTVKETLNNFGFKEDEGGMNVPHTVTSILNCVQGQTPCVHGSGTTIEEKKKQCFYETRGITAVYVCSCGCGLEVQLENRNLDNEPSHNEQMVKSNENCTENYQESHPTRREKRIKRQRDFIANKKIVGQHSENQSQPLNYDRQGSSQSQSNSDNNNQCQQPNFNQSFVPQQFNAPPWRPPMEQPRMFQPGFLPPPRNAPPFNQANIPRQVFQGRGGWGNQRFRHPNF